MQTDAATSVVEHSGCRRCVCRKGRPCGLHYQVISVAVASLYDTSVSEKDRRRLRDKIRYLECFVAGPDGANALASLLEVNLDTATEKPDA